MTLIVVSDQHIGAGASLGNRLADQESSWVRVCTTAAELGATVLHGGDVFHNKKATPSDMRAYQAGLDILREGECEMIVAAGNHDVQSADAPTSVEAASAGYWVTVCREPQVIRTEDCAVAVLPWMPPRMSARETAEALMIVAADLAERGARVLIAHWAVAGGSLPRGLPVLELAEPLLDPYALSTMFDVTLVGHIHKRQTLVDAPLVAHIGPLNRTSFSEADEWTGAWQIVTAGAPGPAEATPFDVDDRRFVTIKRDVRGDATPTATLLESIEQHDVASAVVRMSWQQTADQVVHQQEILDELLTAGAWSIQQLTPIVERVQSTRSVGLTEQDDPTVAFDHWLDAQADLAAPETMAVVRERAHERIGGAS